MVEFDDFIDGFYIKYIPIGRILVIARFNKIEQSLAAKMISVSPQRNFF